MDKTFDVLRRGRSLGEQQACGDGNDFVARIYTVHATSWRVD